MVEKKTIGGLKTAVLGAGNILMGDDGIGVHVVRKLKEHGGLPDGTEVIDAGTATLDALPLLDGIEHLIIIDAVKGGGSPGTIYQFSPNDITERPSGRVSLHQMTLLESLASEHMLSGGSRRISIVGVEPKEIMESLELSPEVKQQIPLIVQTVRNLVDS